MALRVQCYAGRKAGREAGEISFSPDEWPLESLRSLR